MPIAISNLTAGTGTADPQSTASVSPAAGSALLVTVGLSFASGVPADSLAPTGLGGTWTKLSSATYGFRRRAWLYLVTGVSGSGALSFDYTGAGVPQEWGWCVDQLTGHDTTTPTEGVAVANSDSSTTQTATSAGTAQTGDATYSGLCLESNINANPEAGWAALGQTTTGSLGVRRVESAWDAAADLSATWTWDGSAQGNAAFVAIVNVAAAGTTVVGRSLGLIWNTRAVAGRALDTRWGVRSFASRSLVAAWNLRSVAGRVADLRWNTRAAAGRAVPLAWNTRASAARTLGASWNVRTLTARSLDTRWSVRTISARSLDTRWAVRTAAGRSLSAVWNVSGALVAVGRSLATLWNTRAPAGRALDARWNIRATATRPLDARWAVRTTAAQALIARWYVRGASAKTLTSVWSVRAAAVRTLDLRWNVAAAPGTPDVLAESVPSVAPVASSAPAVSAVASSALAVTSPA